MKIWFDDIRPMPEGFDVWIKTSEECLAFILENSKKIELISFDHDLGGEDTTMPVAKMLERAAYFNEIKPIKWRVHSANPEGRRNLIATLTKADEYWSSHNKT